jgi:hypothetical protein
MGNGGIALHILNLGAESRGDVTFTSWTLYAEGKFSGFQWIAS